MEPCFDNNTRHWSWSWIIFQFLDRVRELQEKAARDEQAALEAEMMAKRKAEAVKAKKAAK